MPPFEVQRLAAFATGRTGGNPAGVVLTDALPSPEQMQRMAADVGYSETAFAAPLEDGFRVRYFAPQMEVPFCGHATIALGAALASARGDATYNLTLNDAAITVRGWREGTQQFAALHSPGTSSTAPSAQLTAKALALFGYDADDLDPRIPPALANAGANHLVIGLASREALARMAYVKADGQALMQEAGLITIALVYANSNQVFHARNPFAAGGVYEDPATGAAAAALAGYLRDLAWPHAGEFTISQGVDMGTPSMIQVRLGATAGESVEVSGAVRTIAQ